MEALILEGLQKLAALLDKWIPFAGARSMAVGAFMIVGHASLFFSGHEDGKTAANWILTGAGIIFAALHKTPPATPPAA